MKERPILFSGAMVRALLNGSKTQTRRVVNPGKDRNFGCEMAPHELAGEVNAGEYGNCPYGQPGDRLWVRESGIYSELLCPDDPKQPGLFRHDVPATPDIGDYWVQRTRAKGASYSVQGSSRSSDLKCLRAKVVPSIYMPRWASRISLEITAVRVERLQNISEADALAEGCVSSIGLQGGRFASENYAWLWDTINGDGSWAANPWVWVVEFKQVLP